VEFTAEFFSLKPLNEDLKRSLLLVLMKLAAPPLLVSGDLEE